MNNSIELVKLLLLNGADYNAKCKTTFRMPIFPNEWSERLKSQKYYLNLL